MKVTKECYKYCSPATDRIIQLRTAKGETEELRPKDKLTALYILTRSKDEEIRTLAEESFKNFPLSPLQSALSEDIDPLVLKKVVDLFTDNSDILTLAAMNVNADDETLITLAENGNEMIIMSIADNKERVLKNPKIIEAMKRSKIVPLDRVEGILMALGLTHAEDEEVAKEELEKLKKEEEEAESGEILEAEEEDMTIIQQIKTMTIAQKIKFAMSGDKEVRSIFLKDANKMISGAALKNPRITDDEVLKLCQTKGTSGDIMRIISGEKDWMSVLAIKMAFITNPKSPIAKVISLFGGLSVKQLETISKSKGIPSAIVNQAKKILTVKKKR